MGFGSFLKNIFVQPSSKAPTETLQYLEDAITDSFVNDAVEPVIEPDKQLPITILHNESATESTFPVDSAPVIGVGFEPMTPEMKEKIRETKLTPKQRQLARLQEKVVLGQMTQKEAILQAGYSESTAKQQSSVLGEVRSNTAMQEALRKVGFDEDFIAEELAEGATTLGHGPTKLAYINSGSKLLDVVPSQKVDKNLNVTGRVHLGAIVDDLDGDEEVEEPEETENEEVKN